MARVRLSRRMAAMEQNLTSRQNADLVDVLRIPEKFVSPVRRIVRRVIYALLVLAAAVLVVYIDRDGYRDVTENRMSLVELVAGLARMPAKRAVHMVSPGFELRANAL